MILRWLPALLLSGCTCGVALCGADAECGPGARCDPGNGVCVAVGAGAGGGGGGGATGALAVRVPPLLPRPAVDGTIYEDVPAAWRRNELVGIWLEASQTVTQPALKLAGIDAVAAVPAACTQPCAGHCTCFVVDLSAPPLAGLRGTFELEASAVDTSGRTLTATDSLQVTRLSWRRALAESVRGTPAIGADGTIYVGTAGAGPSKSGALFAISAAGQEKWSKPLGRIDAAVTVSAQQVFAGSASGNAAQLTALDGAGTQVGQCMLSKDADLEAAPALIGSGAVFYANKTHELVALRPSLNPVCTIAHADKDIDFPNGLVVSGLSTFFVDGTASVFRFDLGGPGWQQYNQDNWPGVALPGYRNRGLAISAGRKLVGAGETLSGGAVFQAAVSGPFTFDYGFFPPRVPAAATGPVVASDGLVLVGVPTGIAAVSATATVVGLGDRIANTPALGEGGRLYALATNGELSEWTYADGKPQRVWTALLEAAGPVAFEASPTLDCARAASGAVLLGRPGILYAASHAGVLQAVIVDARGIDTTAQWPKHQKDPRNSGSADTGLSEFACP